MSSRVHPPSPPRPHLGTMLALVLAAGWAHGCKNDDAATEADGKAKVANDEAADDGAPKADDGTPVAPDQDGGKEADDGSGSAALPGALAVATPELEGVDAFSILSAEVADAMAKKGYVFAARYIRHATKSETKHITRAEAEAILGAGLALVLVQEGRGWHETMPTAELGRSDGEVAVQEAQALGYPAGAVVFLDVESVSNPEAKAEDVIAFATAWHDAVKGRYAPGYYVGPGGKLSAEQLGALPFEHFWKSGTHVPSPAGRGYQLVQYRDDDKADNAVDGVDIDHDRTQNDEQGGAIPWLAPPQRG